MLCKSVIKIYVVLHAKHIVYKNGSPTWVIVEHLERNVYSHNFSTIEFIIKSHDQTLIILPSLKEAGVYYMLLNLFSVFWSEMSAASDQI